MSSSNFKARDWVFRPTALGDALRKSGMIEGNLALVREPKLARNGNVISADFKEAA